MLKPSYHSNLLGWKESQPSGVFLKQKSMVSYVCSENTIVPRPIRGSKPRAALEKATVKLQVVLCLLEALGISRDRIP